jgi:hypothetical protein
MDVAVLTGANLVESRAARKHVVKENPIAVVQGHTFGMIATAIQVTTT